MEDRTMESTKDQDYASSIKKYIEPAEEDVYSSSGSPDLCSNDAPTMLQVADENKALREQLATWQKRAEDAETRLEASEKKHADVIPSFKALLS
eukprot:gene10510-19286_t